MSQRSGFLCLLLAIHHPRSEVQVGNIFMIYYCIINHPSIWKLKAATLTTSEHLWVRNPHTASWGPPAQGLSGRWSQGFSQVCFCLKAQLGQEPLQAHHGVLIGHDPMQVLRLWDLDFCWVLTAGHCQFLAMWAFLSTSSQTQQLYYIGQ